MKWWGGIAVVIGILTSCQTVHAAPVTDYVVINEIMANPTTGEVEWIELYNPTDATITMSGWRLVVGSTNFSNVFASDVVIAAHDYVVRSASDTSSKLNNSSATIVLKPSASGAAIDTVTYSGIAQAKTYARECDASDVWVTQATPTKSATNCVPAVPKDTTPPVIHEIVTTALSGNATVAITATDETSDTTITASMTQYGTEVAAASGVNSAELALNTTILPNGSAILTITATDSEGNVATKTVELTIQNEVKTIPSKPEPVAKPAIVLPSAPPLPSPTPTTEPTPVPAEPMPLVVVTRPIAALQAVSVTSTVSRAVASPIIVAANPTRAATTANNAKSNEANPSVSLVTISAAAPANGGGSAQVAATNKSSAIAFIYIVCAGLGVIVVSFALWRYLRRTKP